MFLSLYKMWIDFRDLLALRDILLVYPNATLRHLQLDSDSAATELSKTNNCRQVALNCVLPTF